MKKDAADCVAQAILGLSPAEKAAYGTALLAERKYDAALRICKQAADLALSLHDNAASAAATKCITDSLAKRDDELTKTLTLNKQLAIVRGRMKAGDYASAQDQAEIVAVSPKASPSEVKEALDLIQSVRTFNLLIEEGIVALSSDAVNHRQQARDLCQRALEINPGNAAAANCIKAAADAERQLGLIALAEGQFKTGERAAAVTNALKVANDSIVSPDPEVRAHASHLLELSHTGFWITVREQLKSSWIADIAAGLILYFGFLLAMNLLRSCWRFCLAQWWKRPGSKVAWTLAPIQDPGNLGAPDFVVDSLRTAPALMKRRLWAPDRLLLNPSADPAYWEEVWCDFVPPKGFHLADSHGKETSRITAVEIKAASGDLSAALQTLTLPLGATSFNIVASLGQSIVTWWKTGGPTFSATVLQAATSSQSQEVTVRLTCAGGPPAHVTVFASSEPQPGLNVVSYAADRAAYKLLYRIQKPDADPAIIDAQAAFRQGADQLYQHYEPVANAAKDARTAALTKALFNFEFARVIFSPLGEEAFILPDILRFHAFTNALLGNQTQALARLEELEDLTTPETRMTDLAQLRREAAFNQAVLHQRNAARDSKSPSAELTQAILAYDRVIEKEDFNQGFTPPRADLDGITFAAECGQINALAQVARSDWPQFDKTAITDWIDRANKFVDNLVQPPPPAAFRVSDQRTWEHIRFQSRRSFAFAALRFIEVFDDVASDRKAFEARSPLPDSLTAQSKARAKFAVGQLEKYAHIVAPAPDLLNALAYAYLLRGHYSAGEAAARKAIALDAACEYAYYLAAEACWLQQRVPDAIKVAEQFTGSVTEPSFAKLKKDLGCPA